MKTKAAIGHHEYFNSDSQFTSMMLAIMSVVKFLTIVTVIAMMIFE